MNGKNFIKYLDKNLKINGASYSGATTPSSKEAKINESNFDDILRYKEFIKTIEDDLTLHIDWLSQAWSDDYYSFFDEVIRCIEYLAREKQLEEPVSITIKLHDRDHFDEVIKSFTIDSY